MTDRTQGNWYAGDAGAFWIAISSDNKGEHVANVRYQTDGSQEPNARIIAAAPDLLEALMELDNAMQDIGGYQEFPGTFEVVRNALIKASC